MLKIEKKTGGGVTDCIDNCCEYRLCVLLSDMSSTSQKHKNFVSEPMGQKVVGDLAGIGTVLGSRLIDEGFDKVRIPHGSKNYIVV